MKTKLVLRLLTDKSELLGWAEVEGDARGDGQIWVDPPTIIPLEQSGTLAHVSVHWCDVNVEIRQDVDHTSVKAGDVMTLPGNWAAITVGPAAGGLPPVTVRSNVAINVPLGALGARGMN